jgi:periplasmic protein TonB
MGYQALLFCPDEKAARGVTQVLSELDFTVEPCTEPFAAVKKLMAQHFDAIVVDCDNEQNATLLFKSARNSSSNQSSLAVAVVEGQAGVAKAFRIGANLVLTKPINIEQAKGTLRVARGLLRKGADPAKPAVDSPVPAVAADATPHATSGARPDAPSVAATASSVKTWPGPAPSPASPRSPQPDAARTGSSGTAVAHNAAPKVDGSAKVEAPPKPAAKPAPTGSQTAPGSQPASAPKKYAWQASKPAAEPMATTLKKAAEAAGIVIHQSHESSAVVTEKTPATSLPATMSSAAAPAPAKERVPAPTPFVPPVAAATPVIEPAKPAPADLPPAREKSFTETAVNPPSFSMGAPAVDEEEPGNSKKALAIVAVVVVLAGMAGYLGWKNMSGKSSTATPNPQVQVPATTPAQLAQGPSPSPSDSAAPSAPAPSSSPVSVSSPVAATPAPKPSAKMIAKDSTTPVAAAPAPSQPPAAAAAAPPASALVVHTETSKPASKPAPSDGDAAAPAPSSLGLTSSADPHALAAIGNTPIAVPKASNQVLKISQGVSEGLVLKKVQPRYPSQALQLHMEGSVQLQATIGKDGSISNLKILSGEAMLARSAQDAVKQWKYKPYYLNGEPVEIQTQITVNFKLPN